MKTTIAAVLLALGLVGCHSEKPIQQAPQIVQARRMETQANMAGGGLRFSAVVMPDSQVPLSFRVPGYVVSLLQVRGQDGRMRDVAEGDRVSQGAVLVRLRPSEYQDKVQQATSQAQAVEAAAQKATLDFERAKRLYESDSLTKSDFDSARAQYDSTQAQLKAASAQISEAQVALRDTSLRVPFNGEIVKKSVELGAFLGPGMPVFAIANTDVVKIVVGVPDTLVHSVKLGQPVEVAVDAFPSRTFHARVSRIASAADPKTRNFEVEIAIPNREHLLKVGMIGSLQLVSGNVEQNQASLLVPLSAIVQANEGKYGVFVLAQSGNGVVARLRPVQIGTVNGSDISVVSGVGTGDEIITSGANLLKDGQRVEVVK